MSKGTFLKAIGIVRLGGDPVLTFLPNGNPVCNFSAAIDDGYKDKNSGQSIERTEWYNFEAFGRLAEVCAEYLKKGSKIYVESVPKTKTNDKNGVKQQFTKFQLKEMTMLDHRTTAPQQPAQQQTPQQPAYQQPAQQQPVAEQNSYPEQTHQN